MTGATSGLGEAFALSLARDYGANIVLTGRRAAALASLALQLEAYGVEARTVMADLSTLDGQEQLIAALQETPIYAAILNAGITYLGDFSDKTRAHYRAMIDLNVTSAAALSHALLPDLKQQSGAIMLTASMGGLTPLPYQSVYAGTKAFLVNFGLSLGKEAQTRPASVTVCAPGGISTAMTAAPEFADQSAFMMPPMDVARIALKAFAARKTLVIPGGQNKLMAAALKVLPQRLVTLVIERSFRRSIARSKTKA